MKILEKFKYILLFLIFLTSSFDIFLSVEMCGYTFRICQLLIMVLMIISIANIIKSKRIEKPLSIIFLIIWALFVLLGTFNTIIPSFNFAYHLWLIFNILILFGFTNYFGEKYDLKLVIKLYLLSFIIVSIFGITQFLLPFIGINPPLVQQWWIPGQLIRANGFSYEPSYYATYLLIGWVMFRLLFKFNKSIELNKKLIIFGFIVTTIAIILSTSRMGIIMLVLFELCNFAYNFFKTLVDRNYKSFLIYLGSIIGSLLVIILVVYFVDKYLIDLNFLLNGTGLNNVPAHSFLDRFKGAIDVFNVFTKSPLLGYGYGGVYTEVALLNNMDVFNGNIQDLGVTFCIFAEALAAGGIIGFIFLIIYFIIICLKPIIKSFKLKNEQEKAFLISLSIALIFEIIILQFNQNILRLYLWIHMALLSLCYSKLIKNKGEVNEKEQ